MSFLIRAAFWLSLVILILPADQESQSDSANGARLSTTEALVAAQATLKDFTSFCSRQPEVCAAGEVAIDNFSAKARYGAKQLYLYLDRDSDGSAPQENAIQERTPADEKLAMNDPTVSQLQQERQVLAEIVRSAE